MNASCTADDELTGYRMFFVPKRGSEWTGTIAVQPYTMLAHGSREVSRTSRFFLPAIAFAFVPLVVERGIDIFVGTTSPKISFGEYCKTTLATRSTSS